MGVVGMAGVVDFFCFGFAASEAPPAAIGFFVGCFGVSREALEPEVAEVGVEGWIEDLGIESEILWRDGHLRCEGSGYCEA